MDAGLVLNKTATVRTPVSLSQSIATDKMNRPTAMKNLLRSLALVTACLTATSLSSSAATLTWNGGVSGDWINGGAGWTGGNWNNATPDAAVFSGVTPTTLTVNSGGITAGNISVSAGTYTIGGTGTLTLSSSTIDIASGLTTTMNAALAGTTGLTKTGAGTLLMSGTNKSYTGGTTINGGAVQISSAAAAGTLAAGTLGSTNTSAVTLNGGSLYTSFTNNMTVNNAITVGASGGEIRNLSTGRFVFGTSNTLSGSGTLTLTFGTGAVRFGASGTGITQTGFSGKWVVDGNGGNASNGFFDLYAEQNLGTGSGDDFLTLKNGGKVLLRGFTLSKGITIGSGGGQIGNGGGLSTTLSGKISGSAGNDIIFDLGGSGTSIVTLSNTGNAWLGATTLSTQGILRLGASGVLADAAGTINISSATAVLDMNGFTETVGGISGSGTVDNQAASTSSTLSAGANNADSTFSGAIKNTGSSASLALVKTGTGTLTLSGASSTYSGGTTVAQGTLIVSNAGALGSGGVTLNATNSGVAGTNRAVLQLSGVTVTGKTLTMDPTTNRAGLVAAAPGGGTWNGTVTLTGSTSANGNLEFTNVTGNGPLTVLGSVGGSLTTGGLTLRGDNANNVLGASVSIGSTPVVKTDAGTWKITSSGNTWGTTTISMGTLLLGASDALPTASNLTMAASTKLDLGSSYSLGVARTGALALSGNATIDFGTAGTAQSLFFGNSSAINWSTFSLTINNWQSGTDLLRFGTDSSGLTSGQLANINFTGFGAGAQIDSSGYVTAVPEPATWFLFALGLTVVVTLRRRKQA